jgi:hypothetical protein
MTTREWHELIRPVLPHASGDTEVPEICVVRFEGSGRTVYAVASDRYTLAATRLVLESPAGDDFAVHVDKADAAASLKLFAHGKDFDPKLRITVDKVPVPVNDRGDTVRSLGVAIESDDGTRLVVRDRPGGLGGWRKNLGALVNRPLAPAADRLLLMPGQLGRWAAAATKGERLTVLAGPDMGDPVLILAEEHFAGMWMPANHIDGDSEDLLADLPWRRELAPDRSAEFDPATGERIVNAVADLARDSGLMVTADGNGAPVIHVPAGADPGALFGAAGEVTGK